MRRQGLRWSILFALIALVPAVAAVAQSAGFSDVDDRNAHADSVAWADESGITHGCGQDPDTGDRLFCPGDAVTRAQMVTFLKRLAEAGLVDAGSIDGLALADLDDRYRLVFQGEYRPGGIYRPGDVVLRNGGSWVATTTTNASPTEAPSDWQQLAAPGASGGPGPAGPRGPAGADGQSASNRDAAPAINMDFGLHSGNAGWNNSITIGTNGWPIVSYYDHQTSALWVAYCQPHDCSTSTSWHQLDNSGTVGQHSSIAIGSDGLPIISYFDQDNSGLKVAHCDTVTCGSATTNLVSNASFEGVRTSIAIGSDGFAIVSHSASSDLKVSHCDNVACSTTTDTVIDSAGNVGIYTSIAAGADGLAVISYYDLDNTALKVAHCDDLVCTSATTTTVDNSAAVGEWNSIAVGADGLPIVSYFDTSTDDLRVAHCDDLVCSSSTNTTIDSADVVGEQTSITIGADGLALITYRDETNDTLKAAHCVDVTCTGATTTTLAANGTFSDHGSSVTIGIDGLPVISYRDTTGPANTSKLSILRCANELCVPFFRRR